MLHIANTIHKHIPWNKGNLIGQKPSLKLNCAQGNVG